jgi:hypothetical protein
MAIKEPKSSISGDAEVTGNITLEVSWKDGDGNTQSAKYTIKSLDTSKEIEFADIRGNNIKLEAQATTSIDYSGSLTFHGDKKSYFDDKLFYGDGTPRQCNLTISHDNGNTSGYEDVKMASEGYTADEGEATETSYDWTALDESSGT